MTDLHQTLPRFTGTTTDGDANTLHAFANRLDELGVDMRSEELREIAERLRPLGLPCQHSQYLMKRTEQ